MTTALVFTYRWPLLLEELMTPRTVEDVVFVEEIKATPLSFIYHEQNWYQMRKRKHDCREEAYWTSFKELPESQVPKELRAWALILS